MIFFSSLSNFSNMYGRKKCWAKSMGRPAPITASLPNNSFDNTSDKIHFSNRWRVSQLLSSCLNHSGSAGIFPSGGEVRVTAVWSLKLSGFGGVTIKLLNQRGSFHCRRFDMSQQKKRSGGKKWFTLGLLVFVSEWVGWKKSCVFY